MTISYNFPSAQIVLSYTGISNENRGKFRREILFISEFTPW